MARGREEVRALLRGQWQNGMVPHIVYHTGPSDYFPDPAFWQVEGSADAPAVPNIWGSPGRDPGDGGAAAA